MTLLTERRSFYRVAVDFPLTVEVDSGPRMKWVAQAINVCVDGIAIKSAHELPINKLFVLHFPREWGPAFAVARVVRRCGHSYGCQFLNLHPRVQQALDLAVYNHLREESPRPMRTLWRYL
jgi:hypothetical protein